MHNYVKIDMQLIGNKPIDPKLLIWLNHSKHCKNISFDVFTELSFVASPHYAFS